MALGFSISDAPSPISPWAGSGRFRAPTDPDETKFRASTRSVLDLVPGGWGWGSDIRDPPLPPRSTSIAYARYVEYAVILPLSEQTETKRYRAGRSHSAVGIVARRSGEPEISRNPDGPLYIWLSRPARGSETDARRNYDVSGGYLEGAVDKRAHPFWSPSLQEPI